VCQKTWPPEVEVCPDDGSWLHDETRVDPKQRDSQPIKISTPEIASADTGHELPAYDDAAAAELIAQRSKDLPPGTKCGDYEIEMKIGVGAMGTVYRAIHPTIGKHVAIKVMSPKLFDEPDAHKRFVTEARALSAIRHPGIVDIFGIGRLPDARTFLTMQWLEGESLGARLRKGPIGTTQSLEILRQVARALEAAHQKGIIHRDLKPENVFLQTVGDETFVKLLDFGLAKATQKDVAVTRSGQILGTPLYMSPEQCRAKGVDHRTDIYALGCLAYELLCGRVPFTYDNAAELIAAHLNAEPPSPRSLKPELPLVLERLLRNMVAKRPEDRPTLAEIRGAIGTVASRQSQPIEAVSDVDERTGESDEFEDDMRTGRRAPIPDLEAARAKWKADKQSPRDSHDTMPAPFPGSSSETTSSRSNPLPSVVVSEKHVETEPVPKRAVGSVTVLLAVLVVVLAAALAIVVLK
jgi:serine/threonine-protein kinase